MLTTLPSSRRLRPDTRQQSFYPRQNPGDDFCNSLAGRMQAIPDIEFWIGDDTVEEKRIENEIILRGDFRIDGVEFLHIVRAEITRSPHSTEQHLDAARLQPLHDFAQS